jgi:hypothetical protein
MRRVIVILVYAAAAFGACAAQRRRRITLPPLAALTRSAPRLRRLLARRPTGSIVAGSSICLAGERSLAETIGQLPGVTLGPNGQVHVRNQ